MNVRIQKVAPSEMPQPRIWTTLELINWTKSYFEKKGLEQPRLEAELLLSDVLGWERIRLYSDFEKPIGAEHLAKFREYVKRRGENREPLQYIVGYTQFLDLKLKVTPAALIPRPETEMLAVWAAERVKETGDAKSLRVLDLCTGTGCIALYVAKKNSEAKIIATDMSDAALELARENAAKVHVEVSVEFRQGDLFGALSDQQPFDLIVSNPPYVDEASKATLQPEVRDHEPAVALFASEGGTALLRRIISEAPKWLKPNGYLGLEFGMGQHERVLEFARATNQFADLKIENDGAGIPRFLHARRA